MSKSTFSLSWEAHRNNICSGLTVLQQNEEFVDMTLAADGHFVKVHQMIMALASPYFKDLISSAAGRHPVIFLNKISYSTLSAILEYIYTGEVLISIDNLSELIQTAKELHIKGLEDMKLQNSLSTVRQIETEEEAEPEKNSLHGLMEKKECSKTIEMDDEICYFEITNRVDTQSQKSPYITVQVDEGTLADKSSNRSVEMNEMDEDVSLEEEESGAKSLSTCPTPSEPFDETIPTPIQYTVSNQGSIQMILNRYLYYLKHSNLNNTRQWRCVDYLNKSKCPAIVMTKNNVVRQRISAHIHEHHDKRILKKVQAGAIFPAIQDAEVEGLLIKVKVKQDKEEKDTNSTKVNTVKESESSSPPAP